MTHWRSHHRYTRHRYCCGFILNTGHVSTAQEIVNGSLHPSGRQADRHRQPSDHTAWMAKSDGRGRTAKKGLGNTWHVQAATIFVTTAIRGDMRSCWLMAETCRSHRSLKSPFHVLALLRLKSSRNHKIPRPEWSQTDGSSSRFFGFFFCPPLF